jgi:hypothetical protein
MNSAIPFLLLFARVKTHDSIDSAAAQTVADIARQASSARRAIGQRIRKLNRDLQNDQNTQ